MAIQECGSTTGRLFFRLDEPIPMRVKAAGSSAEVVLAADGGRERRFACPANGGWAYFTIEPHALSPGEWTVTAGGKRCALTVVPSVEQTPFGIAVYQASLDYTKPPWHAHDMPIEQRIATLRDDYGVNTLLWWYMNGWVPPEHPPVPDRDPRVRPESVDRITRSLARFMQVNVVARMHQPGGPENDWSDEAAIMSCRYTTRLAAQRGRPFGGFIGLHLADEPGLSWGVMHADGHCEPFRGQKDGIYAGPLAVPPQLAGYTRATGRPAPDTLHPEKDIDNWAAFMRWRTTVLGDVFATLSRDVKAVDPDLISTGQLYAWEAFIDGVYIRTETHGVDLVCTHAYPDRHIGLWYPVHETDCVRTGAWDKPLWQLPVWPGCAPADGIRAAVYSTLARKVEGLIWSLDSMITWPQAKEVMQKILPISGMLALAEKPRDPVAIFFSREEMIHAIAADQKESTSSGHQYVGRLNSAWLTAMAAHYPAVQVIEEDALTGAIAAHRVVIAPHLTHCPQPVLAALERYVAQGGTLLLDKNSTVQVEGALTLSFAFPDAFEGRTMSDRVMFDSLILPHVKALASTFRMIALIPGTSDWHAAPVAECDNPWFLLSLQNADCGRYLWAVNMAQDDRKDAKAPRWNPVPAKAIVTLPTGWGAIYDVFARKRVEAGPMRLSLDAGDAAIFALMPSAIERVAVQRLTFDAPSLELAASVENADMCVDAVIPLEIRITPPGVPSPDGSTLRPLYRATRHGRFSERIAIGATPVEGEWRVTITELLSGQSATQSVIVARGDGRLFDAPAVDLFDAQRIAEALRPEKGEILVLHGDGAAGQAEKLAAALKARGRAARADRAERHTGHTISIDTKIWPLEQPPLAIGRQVVLVGDRRNALMKLLVDSYLLCPRLIDEAYPGAGRAIVWWANGMFGLENDIVAVYATDAAGMEAGVRTVEEIVG